MLVSPGGQERSAEEYDVLLRRAGLHVTRIVPTTTEVDCSCTPNGARSR